MTATDQPTGALAAKPTDVRAREWPNAALALLAAGLVVAILDAVVVPILVQEQATDWKAYEGAATLLARGASPYVWTADPDVRAITDYPYIYPPPLAAIWGAGLTPALFAALKVVALGAMALLVRVAGPASPAATVAAAAALVGVTLASPPVLHDLVLGNVMTLYVAGAALVLALPGQPLAGAPLGILVAVALKPAIAPFLVWMLLRRRDQFVAAFVAGVGTTGVFAVLLGPSVFVDYLVALPRLGNLAEPFTGNLGLASISLVLAVVAIPVSIGWVVLAARSLDPWASAAVAVGMTFLAQPTLGLNYAGLLAPGLVALWFVDRRATLALVVALPVTAVISPPLAGAVLAAVATAVGRRRPRTSVPDAAAAAA